MPIGVVRLVIVLGVLAFITPYSFAKDRALLIGIDEYQNPYVRDISGCENDTKLLHEFLVAKLGFKDRDIKILVNADATEANIRNIFQTWLIDGSDPGDRVFFAYSGHGTRVPDTSGDENEDGMDEALAVYDVAPKLPIVRYQPVIPASGYVLDDDISRWIANLFGRQVVMLFDSCYSGTISRGVNNREGLDSRFLTLKDESGPSAADDTYSPDYNKSPKQRDIDTITEGFLDSVMNGVVVISAAKADQEAFPVFATRYGRKQGALTYLFVEKQLGGLVPTETLQSVLNLGIEELKQARLLKAGRNGQYQNPQVEIYSQQHAALPIFGGLTNASWTAAPEVALHNPLSKTRVVVWTQDNRREYSTTRPNEYGKPGETIPLVVKTTDAGYLYIWVFSVGNEAKCVFPSKYDEKNFVKAGTYSFPRCGGGKEKCLPEEEYELFASPPEGNDLWVALITDKPLPLRDKDYVYTWAEAFQAIGLPAVQSGLNEYVKKAITRGGDVRLAQTPIVKAWQAGTIILNTHK